ncbi:TetR/AcrR family transcriptional regulator [Novosphingobium album (ex Hu et al. 2023)]|uniref:TetR/AcrR family transcriptional regulator n=1 Tax=Novosphingobium album (ex Hu et al. 2023) TaxID=2930093 RepID=A0ABT0B7F4_9SPHN|nr:TetR/AcrR family transcriptional regulator [Novosphingobium album (ex Hu et al. 2023)]MCJ2181002.1 TetR/AcrR family transcriptional regulator [Novosphingobium album (ex Hu et al. 2023)]
MRKEQVLNAAEQCFRAEGFHAASMSRIAAGAKMSVGHIYQYFESKEAIIIALCERRFSEFEKLLTAADQGMHAASASFVEAWISQFAWWIDPVRAPLTLEIMAEAGRNPKVAAVVMGIDRHFRDIMRHSVVPLAKLRPEEQIEERLEAIIMLAHGMTSRITADPNANPDRIIAAFRLAVQTLLT